MNNPILYRKRFIPFETICLKNDKIIFIDENIIITTWDALKPRADFTHGVSCYYLKKGYKISKFIDKNNVCIYHYCDIIETEYNSVENSYTFTDLLIDVVIYSDGFVKVLDIGEISEALTEKLITVDMAKKALDLTDVLLKIIYSGEFDKLSENLKLAKN